MKILFRIILVGLFLGLSVIGLVAGKYYRDKQEARLNNVVFESSDGKWTDFTDNLKGRQFGSVAWTFEAYKFSENKPEVTLVRITHRPAGAKDLVEWKVPVGISSGEAKPYPAFTKPAQRDEIFRRAKATIEYWAKK